MNRLVNSPKSLLGELVKASKVGAGRTLASVGTVVVTAPLLLIALFPLALLALVMLPPVGIWVAASSLLSDSV